MLVYVCTVGAVSITTAPYAAVFGKKHEEKVRKINALLVKETFGKKKKFSAAVF
jgi:hypothetical protein